MRASLRALLTVALFCTGAAAQDIAYYRVVSTQQTVITSLAGDGTLTWTNSTPDSSCRVVWSFWLDGSWMTNFAFSNIVWTGAVMSTSVQAPDAVPSACTCIHNLYRLLWAKQRFMDDNHLSFGSPVTPWNLLPYLGGSLPSCPNGGMYWIGDLGFDPVCDLAGHNLP
jgi:hypothetical protein